MAQHPHLFRNHRAILLGRSQPRLSCEFPPLSSLFLLLAERALFARRRVIPASQGEGADHIARYQRRSADTWQGNLQDVLPFVDILLPNEREAMKIAGTNDLDAAVDNLAQQVPLLVVKLGRQGAMARRGSERFLSPALKVDAVDPVGAGDSFDAGFLHEFVRGSDLATCLASGNRAGALSTTRPGGTEAFRDVDHREEFMKKQSAT